MNNLLAGIVTYEASASLGLPDCYGGICIVSGLLLFGLALCLIPEKANAEIDCDVPVAVRE